MGNGKWEMGNGKWESETEVDRRGEDLEERLFNFAARIGKVVNAVPETRLGRHIAGQLVRSGTSPAPSYPEAVPQKVNGTSFTNLELSSKNSAKLTRGSS